MGLKRISLTKITRNPKQPRKEFDEQELRELADSINENGLSQPITVRPLPKDDPRWEQGIVYEIVMGERRFRAHQLLGADDILAHVKRMDADEMQIAVIIENLQRADISPLEEARAYQERLDAGMTVDQLARAVGLKSQPWRILYRTRLLKLAPEHQTLLGAGALSLNAAQEIAKLPPPMQTRVVQRINLGMIKGDAQVSAAVNALIDGLTQSDIFGESAKASESDVQIVSRMERKIEDVEKLVAQGWKDGECVAATKVDPGRAGVMADKLEHIRKALYAMERELRTVSVQAELLSEAA